MCLSTPPGMIVRRARRILSDLPRHSLRLRVPGLPSTGFLPSDPCYGPLLMRGVHATILHLPPSRRSPSSPATRGGLFQDAANALPNQGFVLVAPTRLCNFCILRVNGPHSQRQCYEFV